MLYLIDDATNTLPASEHMNKETYPAADVRRYLNRLLRSGVDLNHIASLSGATTEELEKALDRSVDTVPFKLADQIYNVTTADKPLYMQVDSSRAHRILVILSEANSISLEEAGRMLSMPACCLSNTLSFQPITLGTWERCSEKAKKRGILLSKL